MSERRESDRRQNERRVTRRDTAEINEQLARDIETMLSHEDSEIRSLIAECFESVA